MEKHLPVYRFSVRELKPGLHASGQIVRGARRLGFEKVEGVLRSEVYFVRGNIAPGELELLGRFLFSDPVTQSWTVARCPVEETGEGNVVEVAYHAGVTDPVADEILRSAGELGVGGIEAAATGQRYEISCSGSERLDDKALETIASKLLANPVVQRFARGCIEPSFPGDDSGVAAVERISIHEMDDATLEALDRSRRSALDKAELQAIRDWFRGEGRACTDVEFEMIAQTWSEHCYHKTFKAIIDVEGGEAAGLPAQVDNILRSYIKSATDEIAAPWIVSAFKDNAGIMRFDETHDISFKVETHNHPSAIEPFGGANTGVGGVIRDVMAVSARPIAVTDVLCFGMPEGDLDVEHIRSGVVAGVQDYGNKMGIPTVNGGIHYHEKYAANPLVYCGCAGIAPRGAFFSDPKPGDRILVLGGRTGRDGIRGATFSSMTMDEGTLETAGTSVQIGAPIVEKKVGEVLIEARNARLFSCITDCGAGGLSSAVGEMAAELGADVELSQVKLKYAGLAPWEIWLSEAQERMVIAVPPAKLEAVVSLCEGNDVEYCDLGAFTGDGRLVVRYRGEKVLDLDCGFLHDGAPRRRLRAKAAVNSVPAAAKALPGKDALLDGDDFKFEELYRNIMGHHAIASKEWAIRRYDHEVQNGTRIGPFAGELQAGPGDAAVIQPLETVGNRGIAISNGFNPRYGEADAYNAGMSALDEAVRNAVASGADPDLIAVVDNFCWGDPRKPENMWSLLCAAKACRDASIAHRAPFFCGKDSFNNEFEAPDGSRIAIPPSLLISAMGIVPDVGCAPTTDFKEAGSTVYLAGEFSPVYPATVLQDVREGSPSRLPGVPGPAFSHKAPEVYRALHKAIRGNLVAACHDLSDGGLGAALAEMCFGGGLGASIELDRTGYAIPKALSPALALFGETNGCLLVEVRDSDVGDFENAMEGQPFVRLGETRAGGTIEIAFGDDIRTVDIETLRRAWSAEGESALGDERAYADATGGQE